MAVSAIAKHGYLILRIFQFDISQSNQIAICRINGIAHNSSAFCLSAENLYRLVALSRIEILNIYSEEFTLKLFIGINSGDYFLPNIASFCEAYERFESGFKRIVLGSKLLLRRDA